MGFDPTELSSVIPAITTALCYPSDNTEPVAEITLPPPQPVNYADVAQNCSTIEGYQWYSDNPSLRNAGGEFDFSRTLPYLNPYMDHSPV